MFNNLFLKTVGMLILFILCIMSSTGINESVMPKVNNTCSFITVSMYDDMLTENDFNTDGLKLVSDSLMLPLEVSKVIIYRGLTNKYERGTTLPSCLLLGLIHGESMGNKNSVSKAGAKGIVQLTDIAVKDIERITGIKINPFKDNEALWGASRFICYYAHKYKSKYRLTNYESMRYAAIYYLGGGVSVERYRKGQIVVDKYTGIKVSDYANILLKRSRLYRKIISG